jgi:hypothetical protein
VIAAQPVSNATLPGEVYECAVLLSAEGKDTAAFERHMALLTPYYTDFGFVNP